jgi:transcriptional regulator with XRE-family HTH domain
MPIIIHQMELEPIYAQLGRLIRAKRRALELHQAELAGHLGVSRATLASIETGRQRVLVHQLYDLAKAFGIAPAELLPTIQAETEIAADLPMPDGLTAKQRAEVATLFARVRPRRDRATKKKK